MIYRAGPDAYNDGQGKFVLPAVQAANPANTQKFPRGDGTWHNLTEVTQLILVGQDGSKVLLTCQNGQLIAQTINP
jgi:hypothetical protein